MNAVSFIFNSFHGAIWFLLIRKHGVGWIIIELNVCGVMLEWLVLESEWKVYPVFVSYSGKTFCEQFDWERPFISRHFNLRLFRVSMIFGACNGLNNLFYIGCILHLFCIYVWYWKLSTCSFVNLCSLYRILNYFFDGTRNLKGMKSFLKRWFYTLNWEIFY